MITYVTTFSGDPVTSSGDSKASEGKNPSNTGNEYTDSEQINEKENNSLPRKTTGLRLEELPQITDREIISPEILATSLVATQTKKKMQSQQIQVSMKKF